MTFVSLGPVRVRPSGRNRPCGLPDRCRQQFHCAESTGRRNSRIASSNRKSSQEFEPTYVTRRPLLSEIQHRKPLSELETAPIALGFLSSGVRSNGSMLTCASCLTLQTPYSVTAVAALMTEKRTQASRSEVAKLSAMAATRFTVTAAINAADSRVIGERRFARAVHWRFCRGDDDTKSKTHRLHRPQRLLRGQNCGARRPHL